MSILGIVLLAGLGVLLLATFLYWAFVTTEGAYLGARVVAWTYDLTARRYDSIKRFNRRDDVWFLAQPMLLALNGVDCPLILDVATGTGRLPDALLHHPHFDGTMIGLDLAYKMLQQAQAKLHLYQDRYPLIHHSAQQLPFLDESFDAVACLEALEFMPAPQRVLGEMARVLRPGGILLITNRVNWEARLMPGKAFTEDELRQALQREGLAQVEFRPWQVYYDLIWARKAGIPSRLGHGTWAPQDVLSCPHCGRAPLQRDPAKDMAAMECPACQSRYPVQNNIYRLAR
jgi:ubiquinone/menaquinone biosynthesis C-methylase UbiE